MSQLSHIVTEANDVAGVPHMHVTVAIATPRERRALLMGADMVSYYLFIPTNVTVIGPSTSDA